MEKEAGSAMGRGKKGGGEKGRKRTGRQPSGGREKKSVRRKICWPGG